MPDVRDRPARVQHPRDVTADMIRELETCEAFEVVGQRARDGDAPWHSGLVMPVRFVRGATRHRRRRRWKLGVLTVAVDLPRVDAQANRLTRADRQLQGANSVVFKIRVNGALFALKGILPLGQVSRDPGAESAQKLERNSSEYKAQVMLCHPSIARVRHAFDGPADLVLPWIPEVWLRTCARWFHGAPWCDGSSTCCTQDFFIPGVIPWRKTTYIVTDYLHTFEQWLLRHERRKPKAPFGLKERTMQIIMLQVGWLRAPCCLIALPHELIGAGE